MECSQQQLERSGKSHRRTLIAWILLTLAAGEFVVRGPVRSFETPTWNDLAQYYAASRLWLRGQNFAKPENFVALWRDEVGSTLDAHAMRTHIAPPPGAVVLLSPIGALPWPAAKIAWLTVLVAALAVTVWSLAKVAGFYFGETRTVLFIAGCLALAPFHTGIANENQTILVVGLCALGIFTANAGNDLASGLLFGAACSMKPHIGSFLVLYYLVQRRWRLFWSAIGITVLLVIIASGWMYVNGVHWLPTYLDNIRMGAAKNTVDDFTSANRARFLLINLQVPFYSFTHSRAYSNITAFSVGAALIAVWTFFVLRQKEEQTGDMLALATIAVIGLLPLYHRLYDASVLAIPLCWCIREWQGTMRRLATLSLLLMAPFLLPTAALLDEAARNGWVPESLQRSSIWETLIMPHQTWLLVALCIVMLCAMAIQRRSIPETARLRSEDRFSLCSQGSVIARQRNIQSAI